MSAAELKKICKLAPHLLFLASSPSRFSSISMQKKKKTTHLFALAKKTMQDTGNETLSRRCAFPKITSTAGGL